MFRRKPPPQPIYKRKPIATAAVILTMVGMFVLGPVGVIYNGMSEELKKKADYDTVVLILRQQKEKDDRQWEEIQNIRQQQATISAPKNLQMMKAIELKVKKLTPTEYVSFINMSSAQQAAYKKYRIDITVWP
jgi:ABC-type lipoprotein release transport system permease subunit